MKSSSLFCCKSLFRMSVIAMLLTSLITVIGVNVTSASPATYFFVDPPVVGNIQPGDTFLIKINVSEAPSTYAWEVYLSWDPALLNASNIKEGDFLHRWVQNPFPPPDRLPKYTTSFAYTPFDEANTEGKTLVYCTLVGAQPIDNWASGDGWLFTLNFTVKDWGRSVLNLYDTRLWDHIAGDPPYPAPTYYPNLDGFFFNEPFHDIAVTNVAASPTRVIVGNSVNINVTVKNEGNFTETFDVAVYADIVAYNSTDPDVVPVGDEITVGTLPVTDLASGATTTLSFTWNTTSVAEDTYTMSAKSLLLDDDTRDNIFIGNAVTIKLPGAPLASFNYSPEHPIVGETITFNASLSSADGGNITNYLWDFDSDGNIDVNITDPITYHAYTTSGTYEVTLTVKDDEGLTDSLAKSISIAKTSSTISIAVSPTSVVLGSNTNISGAISPVRAQVTMTIHYRHGSETWIALTTVETNSSGQYYYTWTPTAFGTYELKSSWQGDANTLASESDVITIVVKAPPVVSFTFTPTVPVVGETVTFTSTSTDPDGSITGYSWDFGDDNFVDEADPVTSHTYTQAGTYTVTLTVTDNEGLTSTATQSIVIGKLSSTISINATLSSITRGESVTITGSITPEREGVTVTILYRLEGEDTWEVLETLTTSENSQYSHDWTPTAAGTYEVKARWEGDANTLGGESDTKPITVQEAPATPDIIFYAVAGTIIVIAVAIAIYFVKFRKKS